MDVRRPEFRPDPSLDHEAMVALQHEIAATARFTNDIHVSPGQDGSRAVVAGVDQAFSGNDAVSAVVVRNGGEVIERTSARLETKLPYIPGLLAFREAPSVIAALERLEQDPDVILFDGSGRIHYRQAGVATHVGVVFDSPTVGVTKNLLCGEPRKVLDTDLPAGTRVAIDPDDEVEGSTEGAIGYALQTRQFAGENRHVNPVYVSPGHRVDEETATDIVETCCAGYKLPEPIRLADRAAAELTR